MRKRWNLVVSLVFQTVLLALLLSTAAAQERERVRVVVEKFMGSKANQVRRYAISALSEQRDVELVATKEVVAALTRLGVTLDNENGYVALSRELKVNAFVDGEVTRYENAWTASLWVKQGDGKFVGQHSWENKKLRRLAVIKKTLWDKLGEAILSAQVVGQEPEPQSQKTTPAADQQETTDLQQQESPNEPETPDTTAGDIPDTPSTVKGSKQHPTALYTRFGIGANWRNNSYKPDDAQPQPFRYYNEFLEASPWFAVFAKWFPAAHFYDEWFAHIGLAVDFGIGLGASSVYQDEESDDPVEPDTTSFAFSVGLLGRIPLDPIELGLTLAFGQRVFETGGFEGLPDVAHRFLRLGASGDISIVDDLGVDLKLAYLLQLGSGEIATDDYFPDLSGGGIEGDIGMYYKVIDWLSIRADWSVQYFFFDTGTSDAFEQVTGGDDAYYCATVGVAYDLRANYR